MCKYNWSLGHTYKGMEIKLHLKSVTMIHPVIGWFVIAGITYDQGSEFIGHEFIKSLIEI